MKLLHLRSIECEHAGLLLHAVLHVLTGLTLSTPGDLAISLGTSDTVREIPTFAAVLVGALGCQNKKQS